MLIGSTLLLKFAGIPEGTLRTITKLADRREGTRAFFSIPTCLGIRAARQLRALGLPLAECERVLDYFRGLPLEHLEAALADGRQNIVFIAPLMALPRLVQAAALDGPELAGLVKLRPDLRPQLLDVYSSLVRLRALLRTEMEAHHGKA